MAHIGDEEISAWVKADAVDASLSTNDRVTHEHHVAEIVLSQLAAVMDVSGWTDNTSTPRLVRSAIAMYYVAWVYNKQYAGQDDNENTTYADLLRGMAGMVVQGL